MKPYRSLLLLWLALFALGAPLQAQPQVVISEIMYHPVEEPVVNANGFAVLDLTADVHEYVELHNPGSTAIRLAGWRFSGEISFTFPATATIQPGQYLLVAKDQARLAAVPAYGLNAAELLGPFVGQLSNKGGTLRLRDQTRPSRLQGAG